MIDSAEIPPLVDEDYLPDLLFSSGGRTWLFCRLKMTNDGCIPGVYAFPLDRIRMYGRFDSGRVWIALVDPIEHYDVDHTLEELADAIST